MNTVVTELTVSVSQEHHTHTSLESNHWHIWASVPCGTPPDQIGTSVPRPGDWLYVLYCTSRPSFVCLNCTTYHLVSFTSLRLSRLEYRVVERSQGQCGVAMHVHPPSDTCFFVCALFLVRCHTPMHGIQNLAVRVSRRHAVARDKYRINLSTH